MDNVRVIPDCPQRPHCLSNQSIPMKTLNKARRLIARHYHTIDRPISDREVIDEIDSLKRKRAKQTLDTADEILYFALIQAECIEDKPS